MTGDVVYEIDRLAGEQSGFRMKDAVVSVPMKAVEHPGDNRGKGLGGDVAQAFIDASRSAGVDVQAILERIKRNDPANKAKAWVMVEPWHEGDQPWPVFVCVGQDVVAEFFPKET